jgi:hypothetical protein
VCPRIGGRRDRPSSPRHRLLQLSGIEDILSSVLDRREDRARRPAPRGRASINLALCPRQSRINNDSGTANPTGLPQRCVVRIGVAITCVGDLSGTNSAQMVRY